MNFHPPSDSIPSPIASLLTSSTNLPKPNAENCITKLLKLSTVIGNSVVALPASKKTRASQRPISPNESDVDAEAVL